MHSRYRSKPDCRHFAHLAVQLLYSDRADGWIVIIVGSLASWLGSFCLYGFGELIEKTSANNTELKKIVAEMKILNSKSNVDEDKKLIKREVRVIEDLKNMGNAFEEGVKTSSKQNVHVYRYPPKHYNGICPTCGSKLNKNANSDTCATCGAIFASKEN